jgi:hypothetical protein
MYRKKQTQKHKIRGGGEETINIDNGNEDKGTYTGNLVNGKRDGRGKMKYENGSVYNGDWFQDEKYGEGEMKYRNGAVYNGDWVNDERYIGKTNKKEVSESYKTAIDYTYYTVQKPSDLIIGKTYLLYTPEDKKREIAVFKEERVHLSQGRNYYSEEYDDEEYVFRHTDYIFGSKTVSNIDKIIISGEVLKEEYEEGNRTKSYFDHIDHRNLKFSSYNQVLLFKDKNPFYNRESKKLPDGPYKNTLEYMYPNVHGGKTKKRKNKVMGRGKKRKTQRYRTL